MLSSLALVFWLILLLNQYADAQSVTTASGPLKASVNSHYFEQPDGRAITLNGSQSWNTLQDFGTNDTPQPLDFNAFANFLTAHGQNFTLLWSVEMPKFCHHPNTVGPPPAYSVTPLPWERTGPGLATDGGLKFDLTKFNQSYFDRLRARVQALDKAGVYAGVYLFTGEYLYRYRCADDGYPLTGANNINGINDGYKGASKTGTAATTMTAPNAITKIQDTYVEKAIDALNDLPNVLWIVSEESDPNSTWWNSHQIAHVREYESKKAHQHPIGYAALSEASDTILYNSDADWVAPGVKISPILSCGNGKPACKVDINDSDHSYWELWSETPQQNRNWAWENFMNGNQVLFMDPYLVYYPREDRNQCVSPKDGVCAAPDKRYDNLRDNLGYIVTFSKKMNLANVYPRGGCSSSGCGSLCSTGYCLAQTPSSGAEYLVYAPNGGTFTVNLAAMSSERKLAVEWFNPSSGAVINEEPIPAGSRAEEFTPPFSGDAVLYLIDTDGHATSKSR